MSKEKVVKPDDVKFNKTDQKMEVEGSDANVNSISEKEQNEIADDASSEEKSSFAKEFISATLPVVSSIISMYEEPILRINLGEIFSKRKREEAIAKRNEALLDFFESLQNSGINPNTVQTYLNDELNRNLKKRYGNVLLIFTAFFSAVSLTIIILNSVFEWGISDIAITALIIELPIQLVGMLYIIVSNLFPKIP